MKRLLIAYIVAFATFAVVDLAWISMVAAPMFQDALGPALASEVRLAPAVAFYVVFPAGLTYFAIAPGMSAASPLRALVNGALFGLFTYATYDLTNYATLNGWTLHITLIDIVYGAVVCAMIAAFTTTVAARLSP